MIEQSAETNLRTLDSLMETLSQYERYRGHEFSQAHVILQCFENFCQAHSKFSRQVLERSEWYCSSGYLDEQYDLPAPVVFITSEQGVPVDENLEGLYYIQSEERLYLTESQRQALANDPTINEAQRQWLLELSPTASGELTMRNGYVLSPRQQQASGENSLIDVALWQRAHDLTSGLRLFLEGPDRGVSHQTVKQMVSALAMAGTKVYTADRELEAPEFDFRELDEDSSDYLENLRTSKKTRLP